MAFADNVALQRHSSRPVDVTWLGQALPRSFFTAIKRDWNGVGQCTTAASMTWPDTNLGTQGHCMMRFEIQGREVSNLAGKLFGVQLEISGHGLDIIYENGHSLTVPKPPFILGGGVGTDVFRRTFGPDILRAIECCPTQMREVQSGVHATIRCVKMEISGFSEIVSEAAATISICLGLQHATGFVQQL